jgi:hypothetical protein
MIFVPCACGVIDVGFYVFFFQIVRTLRLFWKWILSFCLLGFTSSGLLLFEEVIINA